MGLKWDPETSRPAYMTRGRMTACAPMTCTDFTTASPPEFLTAIATELIDRKLKSACSSSRLWRASKETYSDAGFCSASLISHALASASSACLYLLAPLVGAISEST